MSEPILLEGSDLECRYQKGNLIVKNISGDRLQNVMLYPNIAGIFCNPSAIGSFDLSPYREIEVKFPFTATISQAETWKSFHGSILFIYTTEEGVAIQHIPLSIPAVGSISLQQKGNSINIRPIFLLMRKIAILQDWIFLNGDAEKIPALIADIRAVCNQNYFITISTIRDMVLAALWQIEQIIKDSNP